MKSTMLNDCDSGEESQRSHSQGVHLDAALSDVFTSSQFLEVGIGIANAVASFHSSGEFLGDLTPKDIVIHSLSSHAPIVELHRRADSSRGKWSFSSREETYPYISPEQTGRVDRVIDYRTDHYSLGIIYYKMLTGTLPFHGKDLPGWVHCHVAQVPSFAPDSTIPGVIQSIVLKLLSKEPDERYQTLSGLVFDLKLCLSQLKEIGKIEPFALGGNDRSKTFRLPQKFYGQTRALHTLHQALRRVVDLGNSEFILVAGEPGIGKTRLVGELRERVVQEGGFFAGAKPDQYKSDMPYSTLASAFMTLVSELLTYDDEKIREWRQSFQSTLEMNAQLIISLVPQFSLIWASSTPLPQLLPAEEEARFATACRQFLSVFAQRSRSLVLFFDDLQWADSSTLKWLGHFFLNALSNAGSNSGLRHVLIIGAYRPNEVAGNQGLVQLLRNIENSKGPFTQIKLDPLTQTDFDHFISDAFHRTSHEIGQVSALIYNKTAGNPFFVRQFLSNLAQEQFISLSTTESGDSAHSGWTFDLNQIRERKFTDNIVDFMAARLKVQPVTTQKILKAAAAIGITSNVATLCALSGLNPAEIHSALANAVEIGLFYRDGDHYRFLHDRIQEAAYSFIPAEERGYYHLRIGRFYLDRTPESDLNSKAFEILSHFEKAGRLLERGEESIRIAELNLLAAKKAKSATAYASAMNYISAGLELCAKSPNSSRYELEFSLSLERAECEYLLGEYEKAEAHCKSLLSFATNRRDQTQVLLIEVSLYEIQGQFDRGVDSLIRCLRLYDIEISAHPSMEQVLSVCDEIWKGLGERKIEDLVHLPVVQDPELLTVLKALSHNICSYFTDEKLFLFQGAYIVNVSIKHGNSAPAVSGYGMVSLFLGPMFGKYREAYEFGKLACTLVDVHGFESARAMALDEFAAFVNYWINPLSTSIQYLRRANEAALKLGQMNWFCYSSFDILTTRLFKGDLLSDVLQESEDFKTRVQELGNIPIYYLLIFLRAFIFRMSGSTSDFTSLTSSEFNQTQFEQNEIEKFPALIQCWYYSFLLQGCVFSGDFEQAERIAQRVEKILWSTAGQYTFPEYHFFRALTLTNLYFTSSSDRQVEYLKNLDSIQEKMRVWVSNSPQNFHHKFALVSAEIARIRGMNEDAMHFYEDAIQAAHQNAFLQYEALAYEMAGKFYATEGFASFSTSYIFKARACYQQWGASGKVKHLEQLHPDLFIIDKSRSISLDGLPIDERIWGGISPENIDLISAVKASQAVSSVIEPEKVIHALLQVILEQSGGQRVVLFLKGKEKQLEIAAEATAFRSDFQSPTFQVSAGASGGETEPSRVAQSILNYVSQTREYVLLNEVGTSANSGTFSTDPYFSSSKPKSLLCMPILRQQDVIGLIYLENDITPYAFSPQHLTVLQLLAAQAAISLQNADLYENLRKAVELRDDFLALASHELRTPIVPLKLYLDLLIRQVQKLPRGILPQLDSLSGAIEKTRGRLDEMQRLIDSLFDESLIKEGRLVLKKERTNLVQLVSQIVQRLEPELRKVGCTVDMQAPTDLIGNWDSPRLEQVVVNLLTNAMKFGPGKMIRVGIDRDAYHTTITVTDQGIGISKEDQSRIFKKFERASSPMKYFGLGLGLHIAQEIAVAHGGVITVQSDPGEGATFTFKLPIGN